MAASRVNLLFFVTLVSTIALIAYASRALLKREKSGLPPLSFNVDDLFPHGEVSPLLSSMNFDDLTFHTKRPELVHLLCDHISLPSIAIVGLGESEPLLDDASFAAVFHLFEPLPEPWVTSMLNSWEPLRKSRTNLHLFGVSDETTSLSIEYGGRRETVSVARIDSLISSRINVLSLDTQGSEFRILKGCSSLFENNHIDVILVEAIVHGNEKSPDNNMDVAGMLRFIEERGFIIFDVVPYGPPHVWGGDKLHQIDMPSDHYKWGKRPNEFDAWLRHLRSLSGNMIYISTDFICIHRKFMTASLLQKLMKLASAPSFLSITLAREAALSHKK